MFRSSRFFNSAKQFCNKQQHNNAFRNFSTSSQTSSSSQQSATAAPKRSKLKSFLLASTAAATATSLYIYNDDDLSERVTRSAYFWRHTMPIYAHYRLTQYTVRNKSEEEQKKAYQVLHEIYAAECMKIILHLKGFYVKLGQIGSIRGDFMPREYIELLSKLQDEVPCEDGEFAVKLIEEQLGQPVDKLFKSFNPTAIAAASIGQVHDAVLHDGTSVVVKLQYPKVKRLFSLDLATVKAFCRLAQPEHLTMLEELAKQMMTEFDFRREGENLKVISSKMHKKFGSEIVVPEPIEGMVTENVLVMTKLYGTKLMNRMKQQLEDLAHRTKRPVKELMDEYYEMLQSPVPIRNPLFEPPKPIVVRMYWWYLRSITALTNLGKTLYNHTIGRVTTQLPYSVALPPVHPQLTLDVLNRVHAHQVLVDGHFNGDCHPGNVLILNDGKLGLIDYGQVKQISSAERLMLSKLIVALAENRSSDIVRIFTEMGFKSKNMNPRIIEQTARVFFDKDDKITTEGKEKQTEVG